MLQFIGSSMDISYFSFLLYSITFGLFLYGFSTFYNWLHDLINIRKALRLHWKGPPYHWLWGHIKKINEGNKNPERMLLYFKEQEKIFKDGFVIYLGPFRAFLRVYNPKLIKQILHASVFDATKSANMRKLFRPWLGKGLLIQEGTEWSRQRRLLTYSFHFDILKSYLVIMNSCTTTLIEKWERRLKGTAETNVEIFNDSSLMTLDAILQCLVSYKSNCQLKENKNSFISSIGVLTSGVISRIRNKNLFLMIDFLYRRSEIGKLFLNECEKVHRFSTSFITERRKAYESGIADDATASDFLDILLQAKDAEGNGFSDLEIRSQLDTFLFGGHDTTSSAISWSLYCLASHPEFQERCAVEADAVMRDNDDLSWSDLSSIPYLTRCIKESLRMYPPAPSIGRVLMKDVEFEGKTIRKGTNVSIAIIAVHRNEEFWKDPDVFDPDRFTLENVSKQHYGAFIPFSAGPRNCIGQNFAMNEVKVALAKLLRRFKFAVDRNHAIVRCHEVVYKTKTGLRLIVTSRK